MGKTLENYIEKLKARIKYLEQMQAEYEKEYDDIKRKKGRAEHCAQYYVNSTEIITLTVVIRDLTKLTVHERSYWNI